MRYVLYPLEIPEACTLGEAYRWVRLREYPLGHAALRIRAGLESWGGTELPDQLPDPTLDFEKWTAKYGQDNRRADSELFAKLRIGALTARGRLSKTYGTRGVRDESSDWQFWNWDISTASPTEIPPSFWMTQGIDWEGSVARNPDGEYQVVSLRTRELFAAFPEPASLPLIMEQRGRYLVSDFAPHRPRRTGRPPKIKWDEFDFELTCVISALATLPKKQARLQTRMAHWCLDHWGFEPANSAIRDRISRIYAEVGRRRPKPTTM